MQRAAPRKKTNHTLPWLIVGIEAGILAVMLIGAVVGLGVVLFYSTERILPGVTAFGVELGALDVDRAAAALRAAWLEEALTMRDGARTWQVAPANLGLSMDAAETAARAQRVGRGEDGLMEGLASLFGGHEAHAAVTIDLAKARVGLENLAAYVNVPAEDARLRIDGTEVYPVPAAPGRVLDIERLLSDLAVRQAAALYKGVLDLPMVETAPDITDVSAAVAQAQQLVGEPFHINAYDPFKDELVHWTVAPETVGGWLAAGRREDGRQVVVSLEEEGPTAHLQEAAAALGEGRTLDIGESLAQMRAAVAAGELSATLRIRSTPTQYTVQHGDTFMAIARRFGIPALYLRDANPNIDPRSLHAGDVVSIPSRDMMLPLPLVLGKRIVIDIGDLRMYVYEHGQLIQNWGTSTGIDDSPTLTGVFQIQTHEELAYASNWDLWMPHFMGIYEAAPGFMNGIHGLPKRGGHTLVWRDALGSYRTSYGCIILGLEEAAWLFNWAEEGVVVEIRD